MPKQMWEEATDHLRSEETETFLREEVKRLRRLLAERDERLLRVVTVALGRE